MADLVSRIAGPDGDAGNAERLAQSTCGLRERLPCVVLELGEVHLDRVRVRAVRRDEDHATLAPLEVVDDLRAFVVAEVVPCRSQLANDRLQSAMLNLRRHQHPHTPKSSAAPQGSVTREPSRS